MNSDVVAAGRRRQRRAPPVALWVTGLTAALMMMGFRPERFSAGVAISSPLRDVSSPESHGAEGDRGRRAETPLRIPAAGWKDILLRIYHNIGDDRVIALAAGVTFYSVLALFPAIAALVALYGLFADPASIASHLDSMAGVLPGGAVSVLGDEMRRVASQGNNKLGLALIVGLGTALWSANAGIKSLFDALNLVYNEPEKRGFIKLNAVSLTFTTAAILFVLLAGGALVVLPIGIKMLGIGAAGEIAAKLLRWPILFVVVAFGLACLYRFAPSRDKPKWRWITWGSAFAALAWIVASLLFSWYAAHFGSYNKTYGSLGAMVGFMVWIWLSVIVILLGAELNAETERQSARDTTTGHPRSMGSRGARMADTVGATQS